MKNKIINVIVILVLILLSVYSVKVRNANIKLNEDIIKLEVSNIKLSGEVDSIKDSNKASEKTNKSKISTIANWCDNQSGSNEYNHIIIKEAFKYDMALLLLSIITVESNFDKDAVSHKKAIGLMQIRWDVWKVELGKNLNIKSRSDLFKIDNNIKVGNYILTKYYHQTGSMSEALYKYSGGDKEYYKKVLDKYAELSIMINGNK